MNATPVSEDEFWEAARDVLERGDDDDRTGDVRLGDRGAEAATV